MALCVVYCFIVAAICSARRTSSSSSSVIAFVSCSGAMLSGGKILFFHVKSVQKYFKFFFCCFIEEFVVELNFQPLRRCAIRPILFALPARRGPHATKSGFARNGKDNLDQDPAL